MTLPLAPSLIGLVQSVAPGLQIKQTELLFTIKEGRSFAVPALTARSATKAEPAQAKAIRTMG
jgi:hypothetical protein